MASIGTLGDEHELSQLALEYANTIIFGNRWPLTADHVDLSLITFETSTRMQRKHGVCSTTSSGESTIRLSAKTFNRAGFDAMQETIRHELVHAYQHQTEGVDTGHGDSFTEWLEALDLDGRCSDHYSADPDDFKYQLYCKGGCGFVSGRYRMCKTIESALENRLVCSDCGNQLRVEESNGVMDETPN